MAFWTVLGGRGAQDRFQDAPGHSALGSLGALWAEKVAQVGALGLLAGCKIGRKSHTFEHRPALLTSK